MARANKAFMIHGGLRYVEVKIAGATEGKRVTCRSQADWLYLSTHGIHSAMHGYPSGALETVEIESGTSSTRVVVSPEEVRWKDDLDVVVIAGCSVLDINDYNDNYSGAQHNDSPGKRWANTGPRILLGYNFGGPSDRGGGSDIARKAVGSMHVSPVTAWHFSNKEKRAWNACAIEIRDELGSPYKYYYYFDVDQIFGKTIRALWTAVPEYQW